MSVLFSQNANNVWYFGRFAGAGIDFNGGTPVALANSEMNAFEGCASVADENGNLLFYTNGEAIWNRDHDTMPNGADLFGHLSSSQSAIIVPKPLSDNLYYVFTVDAAENSGVAGLRYSEVNIDLDGGKGDIAGMKNIQLIAPARERLTSVRHTNCRDKWVITHTPNGFYSYLVTPEGVDTNAVISNVGNIDLTTSGQIKVAPNNELLVVTQSSTGPDKGVELYKFDAATGVVSDPLLLTTASIYGAEFSPSSEVLYLGEFSSGEVKQYDLTVTNIAASETPVLNLGLVIGSLQLAPDNKIYISRGRSYLSVINSPDVLGLGCNAVDTGFVLSVGTFSSLGLPQKIIETMEPEVDFVVDTPFLCNDQSAFTFISLIDTTQYPILVLDWNFGDGDSISGNEVVHVYTAPGNYDVTLTASFLGCSIDTTKIAFVTVYENPEADFIANPDRVTVSDPLVSFTDQSVSTSPIERWFWKFGELGESEEQHPEYNFSELGVGNHEVLFVVIDEQGCVDTTVQVIEIEDDLVLYLPNTFTPNGDGLNDGLEIVGSGFLEEGYMLSIYNRWGEEIYRTEDTEDIWDGDVCQNGIYVWRIECMDTENRLHTFTGHVNLVR